MAVEPAWMSTVDDALLLSQLSIPGTHESAALYEPIAGSAKCQSLTIAEQLDAGVRYFDIRCRHVDDAFAIFHGPVDELQTFDEVTAAMTAFLDAHPSETVMMSVKEESEPVNMTRSFEATFAAYVARDPARWFLADEVPTLADTRGKLVLVRRFAATTRPLGIDASDWADDTTFTITANATLRVQDAYRVTSTDAKWSSITDLVDEARDGSTSTLFLNYSSGYVSHGLLPNNREVADVINPQLDALLAEPERAHARLGVLAMDHVNETRIQAIVRSNAPP